MLGVYSRDKIAEETFLGLASQVGISGCAAVSDPFGSEDLVVMGTMGRDALMGEIFLRPEFEPPQIRMGSDDYFIRSYHDGQRRVLLLGGGRLRAVLYAIYDYFERLGCGYFWDGDVYPRLSSLPLDGFAVVERPRFEYRGIRYFAHRSLHRFQAEHWTLSDWQREIDWMLKKRLNLFMLRLGMDDVFQKAFPAAVPYPEDGVPCDPVFSRSYNNRVHFWSLEERGKLRKALLDYGFARDLIHPEDLGTMTHWYSPTPQSFIDTVKPTFLPQAYSPHSGKTLEVWDIRQDENLENYFKLTEAHIQHYGKAEMFHTIGLAERHISEDPAVNLRWKLYAYQRVIERLRQSYPQAPLLIATWDFMSALWNSDRIGELLQTFDPANTLIFDYTSDGESELNYFMNWHVYHKFPWIFGIFQAFESGSDLRGNYPVIERRLALAAEDPCCKGFVLWPENSHTDVLMQEYFAANAWQPNKRHIRVFIPEFCRKRYPGMSGQMEALWLAFLPVLECGYWNFGQFYGETFAHLGIGMSCGAGKVTFSMIPAFQQALKRVSPCVKPAAKALELLRQIPCDLPRVRRDVLDLARTTAARLFQFMHNDVWIKHFAGVKDQEDELETMRQVMMTLKQILDASEEFSLNDSLDALKKAAPVNPIFEQTLKANAENEYCRSFISELFDGCYLKEFEVFAEQIRTGKQDDEAYKAIQDEFYATPLETYRPDHEKALRKLPESLRCLQKLAERTADFL